MDLRLIIPLILLVILAGGAFGSVKTTTYVEYVEIWEQYYGGRIYWDISGEQASMLRSALANNYDGNHNGELEMGEAVAYIKDIAKALKGEYVGTVIVSDARPLHDWYEGGGSVDEGDIEGLLGSLNSTDPISIKMRFSGNPADTGSMNSLNLTKIPFAVALRTSLENITIDKGIIKREHTEIGATFSSYEKMPGAIAFRLVVGMYYHYEGQIPEDETIQKVDFYIWDSPLFLFIAVLISAKVATWIERRNYDKFIDRGSTFSRKHKVGLLNLGLKIVLIVFYVLAAFYVFHVPGTYLLVFCAAYVIIIGAVSHKLYSSKLPTVKKGILMVEDVFLLSKSGIMISHETRRLKPEVDEDVISGMLVAIQEFVSQSFKDEGDVSLRKIEFGDKKIYIQRGKYLILAAVLRGEIDRYVEHRIKTVLDEIEKKFADILPNWKGDVEKFRGVRDMLRKIWE